MKYMSTLKIKIHNKRRVMLALRDGLNTLGSLILQSYRRAWRFIAGES